jgi:putative hydrolases of HD superfamily
MSKKISKLLDFVKLTNTFQQVKRDVLAVGEDRYENDAEHSFQLAIVAWFIIENDKLKLDLNLVIKFCIIHDLVEVYAGDTPIFSSLVSTKADREAKALKKLSKNFPHFKNLLHLIEQYERQDTPESRFVYSLDKLLPGLNIYLDNFRTWKKDGTNLHDWHAQKTGKMSGHKSILDYYSEFFEIVTQMRYQPRTL